MAQFVTNVELATRLGLVLTVEEQARADSLLTLASGLIQGETEQTIERVVDDSLQRKGTHSSCVRLPERPVESVTSVTLNGETLVEGTEFYRIGDELIRLRGAPESHFDWQSYGGGWGYPYHDLTVVYTHGYAVIPAEVKAVCIEAVVRVWVNPGAVAQQAIGGASTAYSFQGNVGMLLTEGERKLLRRTIGREAGTVTLR